MIKTPRICVIMRMLSWSVIDTCLQRGGSRIGLARVRHGGFQCPGPQSEVKVFLRYPVCCSHQSTPWIHHLLLVSNIQIKLNMLANALPWTKTSGQKTKLVRTGFTGRNIIHGLRKYKGLYHYLCLSLPQVHV